MNRADGPHGSEREHDTLVPIITDRLSVEDDAVLDGMHSGEKTKLVAVLVAAALVLGGGYAWMKRADARAAYLGAATQTEQLVDKTLQTFAECTAPSAATASGEAKAVWSELLVSRSALAGRAHAQALARCVPLLDALGVELSAIDAPADLAGPLTNTRDASGELRARFESYRRYVAASGARFDAAEGKQLADRAVSAWTALEQRTVELRAAAQAHTGS